MPKTKGSRPSGVKLSAEQRKMLVAIRSEIDRTRCELRDEQSSLDALRSQHAGFHQAHATVLRRRQALLLARADDDKVAEADRGVREVDDNITALSAAIAAQEARVSQLAAELADAEAQEVEGKAQEAEAHAVALERALGNLKPVMTEFANACRSAGVIVPEPMGIARSMSDIFRHVEDDTAHCAELLRQRARALRQEPPPALLPSKDTSRPELMPKPWRQSNLLKRLFDWKARAAARVYAGAKRAQSWWVFWHNDAAERLVDWKVSATGRIHALAKRAQSWGVFRLSNAAERIVDWKASAASRVYFNAKRAQSWWQGLVASSRNEKAGFGSSSQGTSLPQHPENPNSSVL